MSTRKGRAMAHSERCRTPRVSREAATALQGQGFELDVDVEGGSTRPRSRRSTALTTPRSIYSFALRTCRSDRHLESMRRHAAGVTMHERARRPGVGRDVGSRRSRSRMARPPYVSPFEARAGVLSAGRRVTQIDSPTPSCPDRSPR